MKAKSKISSVLVGLSLISFALAGSAFAQDRRGEESHGRRDEHRGAFLMGVCVGQNLAQQGITLAPPTHGENYLNPSGDPTTEQTIHAAVQSCRTQFVGGPVASGSPTNPVPSVLPSPVPSIEQPSAPPALPSPGTS